MTGPQLQDAPPGYQRPHDRLQCTAELEASCGGSGVHLQEHCLPRPSTRFHRGMFVTVCTSLVMGFLIVMFNGPRRNEFLAPGPLADKHAQILQQHGAARCSTCHAAGDATLTSWIADAVSSGRHLPVSQSQLCLDCHRSDLFDEFALHAHNLPPSQLAAVTASLRDHHPGQSMGHPYDAESELACSSCHREHHGANFDLTALTDKQCQVCHSQQFRSFSEGHPEFVDWPFRRRTAIAFDHVSHALKHFEEKNTEFDCRQCHIDDAGGVVKLVAPFETSCGQCHTEQIQNSSQPGFTLFRLPMVDQQAIADAGLSIGTWPPFAQGDFDGQLSPAMKLMLSADAKAAQILSRRGQDFQFGDFDPENSADIDDAVALVWSIKRLLNELAEDSESFERRLHTALQRDLTGVQLQGMASGLNQAMFRDARDRWLPDVATELVQYQSATNERIRTRRAVFGRPNLAGLQDQTVPLAENPLSRIFADDDSAQPHLSTANSHPAIIHHNPPATAGSADQPIHNQYIGEDASRPPKTVLQIQSANEADLLARNPLVDLLAGEAGAPSTPPTIQTPVVELAPDENDRLASDDAAAVTRKKLPISDGPGWYRDDRTFSISYRPAGHADPLVRHWTDAALNAAHQPAVSVSGLLEQLNHVEGMGTCRSCHTVDASPEGDLVANWSPRYRDVSVNSFTEFAHRPHDIQKSLQDCTSCHQLDSSATNAKRFRSLDTSDFRSNFVAISRSDCASCHRPGGASHGCVDCHRYHIGSRVPHRR